VAALNIVAFATDVIRNASYYLFAQIFSRIVNFFYMLFLAAHLPTDQFGALNIALTILIVADTIADLGLSRLAVRTLARDASLVSTHAGRLLALKLILSLTVYGICVGGILLGGQGPDVTLFVAVIGAGLLLTGMSAMLEGVLQSQSMFGYIGAAHVLLSLVQAGTGVWVILAGAGPAALAVTFLFSNFAFVAVTLGGVIRKAGLGSLRIDPEFCRTQILQALPYAATAIVLIVSMRCELLILSWASTPEQVAYFSVAAKLNEAAILAPTVLSTVLVPIYSRYHHELPGKLTQSYAPVLKWGLVGAIPAALLGAFLAEPLLALVLPKYSSSADFAAIMFMAMPLYAVFQLNNAVLFGSDRQGRTMLLLTGLTLLQFALGIGIIVPYVAQGAALSYAMWTLAAAIVSTLITRAWYLPGLSLFCALGPAASGAAAMAAMLWMTWESHSAVMFASAVAAYGLTVWVVVLIQRRGCRATGALS
jgi:O-antigen/teichoic acid export membrane protein